MTTPFKLKSGRGFTLLEVMVAVAILAVTIVPMLLLREESYSKAILTKSLRLAQELARYQLTTIALEVRTGQGTGEFEGYPDFRYEYKVTLYDFAAGLEEDDEKDRDLYFGNNAPDDAVYPDDDEKEYGPMVMRHVELRIYYPSMREGEGEMEEEYVVDTYLPVLLTEEQYDYQNKGLEEEPGL